MGAMIKQKEELKEQCHMVHIFSAHNKISEIAWCLKYSLKVFFWPMFFSLQPEPGGPPFGPLGLGPPGSPGLSP
jgi:hypothetical protein